MGDVTAKNVNWLAVELDAAVKEVSKWSDGLRRNIDTQQAQKPSIYTDTKQSVAQNGQSE